MGFLDKAKAAATELSAKADQALASQGLAGPAAAGKQADKFFRDLGVLAYLDATGRPADGDEKARVMAALQGFEGQGALPSFALQTAAPRLLARRPRGMPPRHRLPAPEAMAPHRRHRRRTGARQRLRRPRPRTGARHPRLRRPNPRPHLHLPPEPDSPAPGT